MRLSACFCVGVSCAVFLGWALDNPLLKAVLPGLTPMNPLTAVCFLLASSACVFIVARSQSSRRFGYGLGWVVALLGAGRLVAYGQGWSGGPDTWLFGAKLDLEMVPNRMAPNTAVAFVLIGAALALADRPWKRSVHPAEILSLLAGGIGLLTVIGYAYSASDITRLAKHIPMALHTGALFIVCALGVLSLRPDRGFVGVLASDRLGGMIARRLLWAVIGVPLVLGGLSLMARRSGLLTHEIGTAAFVLAVIAILTSVAWSGARCLNRIDEDRRAAERAILQATESATDARAEAMRANCAKSEFLSRMSHELRTPLNSVLGFAQLIEHEPLTARQVECVEQITKGGKHLLSLINEVLDISRIESGNLGASIEAVDLRGIVDQAMSLAGPLGKEQNITLTPPDGDGPLFVMGDRQRLTQVVLNLLSNAIKYNRPNGTVQLFVAVTGATTTLRVQDSGFGIDPDHSHKLFEPFERLGANSRGLEGTGLGLALSRRLAEAMGGDLRLASSSEHGATFELNLTTTSDPTDDLVLVLPVLHRPTSSVRRHCRLLQIEDNASNVRLIEHILRDRVNCELLLAMHGRLGIDMAREHVPDLILLDLNLPDLHGSEILVELKADPNTALIPVIVVSADATQKQVERIKALGADAYLTKPLDIAELLTTLDALLEGATSLQRSA